MHIPIDKLTNSLYNAFAFRNSVLYFISVFLLVRIGSIIVMRGVDNAKMWVRPPPLPPTSVQIVFVSQQI